MKPIHALLAAIFACLFSATTVLAQANTCITPGAVYTIATPQKLGNTPAELYATFDATRLPVQVISQTSSRLQIRFPSSGLPTGKNFKLVYVDSKGRDSVINARHRLCDAVTGASTGGGTVSGGATNQPSNGSVSTNANGAVSGGSTSSQAETARQAFRKRLANRVPLERATRNDVAAPSGAPEYVIVGSGAAISEAQVVLTSAGASILRSVSLGSLGVRIVSIDLNGAMTLSQMRALLAQRRIAVTVDRHTVYAAAKGRVYASRLVGLPPETSCTLRRSVRIGLIDGPVDLKTPALQGVTIFSNSVLNARERVGSADHATGIAALIASPGAHDIPPGFAPGAQLFSVVAFARNGGRDVARLENIAEALDWLISRKVSLVNMSLAGAPNDTLEEIIRIADAKGLIMVAAAGNAGRERVAYPASDPRVIAVTAVDAAKRLYRKANTGKQVDFAAPGVDLLVPRNRGSAYRTGTSYAAAVASGLIAQELARGRIDRRTLINRLKSRAEDLGAAGRDSQFGWGLLKTPGC